MRATLLLGLAIAFLSCNRSKNNHKFSSEKEQDFYTEHQGMDYIRFPLIMPYEVICTDLQEMNWLVDLKTNPNYYSSITKLQKIAISKGVISIYSMDNTLVTAGQEVWHWFVVFPSKKIEIGFSSEKAFNEYIKSNGITNLNWIEPNEAYHQFKKTECLPWIEGCSQ